MILKFGGNWLMRGENTSVINTTLQKMSPVKDVRVQVIRSLINRKGLSRKESYRHSCSIECSCYFLA